VQPEDRIWEIVEKVGVCMMTTRFSAGLRARPLEARADSDEATIWFLTDRRAPASSSVASCEFAKARATGKRPNLGEKRKSTMKLN
jgi:general stress protein 26